MRLVSTSFGVAALLTFIDWRVRIIRIHTHGRIFLSMMEDSSVFEVMILVDDVIIPFIYFQLDFIAEEITHCLTILIFLFSSLKFLRRQRDIIFASLIRWSYTLLNISYEDIHCIIDSFFFKMSSSFLDSFFFL